MDLDIERILTELLKERDSKFTYQGREIPKNRLYSPAGGLPLFAKKASQLSDFLFSEPLQLNYKTNPEALTGEELIILDKAHSFNLVMLLYDTVEELIVNAGDGDVVL